MPCRGQEIAAALNEAGYFQHHQRRRLKMKNQSRFATYGILAIAIVMGLAVPARGKGSATCGYNVMSSIALTDANNNPFQLQSDPQGPYVTYGNAKSDHVTSVIQANSCDWLLDLSGSTSRTVRLTLAYPDSAISTNPPPPFTGTKNLAARIISICSLNTLNNDITFGTMTFAGQTLQCSLNISFNYNGNSYQLDMNPTRRTGTTWIQAACSGASSGQCISWSVLPIPNGPVNLSTNQNTAIGELFLVGAGERLTTIGLYEVAFSISITNP
jgi:hypothetical protein